MVQLWHYRAGNLKSVLHVPHTMSACGIDFRCWVGVIAAAVVRFRYFAIYDFLTNFIWFFRQFNVFFQYFWFWNSVYVQVFYYYCVFVHYFSTSTGALVCTWILFLHVCIWILGVGLDSDELLVCSWWVTFQASTIIGLWIWGCSLYTSLFLLHCCSN